MLALAQAPGQEWPIAEALLGHAQHAWIQSTKKIKCAAVAWPGVVGGTGGPARPPPSPAALCSLPLRGPLCAALPHPALQDF